MSTVKAKNTQERKKTSNLHEFSRHGKFFNFIDSIEEKCFDNSIEALYQVGLQSWKNLQYNLQGT